MGPVISKPAYDRILKHVELAQEEGAELACGGRRPQGVTRRRQSLVRSGVRKLGISIVTSGRVIRASNLEIRISKFETNSKHKAQNSKLCMRSTEQIGGVVADHSGLKHSDFGFWSCFGFRIFCDLRAVSLAFAAVSPDHASSLWCTLASPAGPMRRSSSPW